MLEPQPDVHETAATHAARLGLLRIVAANATSHPPPSLNSYRTAAARAPVALSVDVSILLGKYRCLILLIYRQISRHDIDI